MAVSPPAVRVRNDCASVSPHRHDTVRSDMKSSPGVRVMRSGTVAAAYGSSGTFLNHAFQRLFTRIANAATMTMQHIILMYRFMCVGVYYLGAKLGKIRKNAKFRQCLACMVYANSLFFDKIIG